LLHPLFGLYLTVMVAVGTEVAVSAEPTAGIVAQQELDEHAEGVFLKRGTGVGGFAMLVQSAFVADADAVGIIAADVCAGFLHRTKGFDVAIAADVIMVSGFTESATDMIGGKIVFRIAAIAAGSGTVYDD
jgi:hypothetical protein